MQAEAVALGHSKQETLKLNFSPVYNAAKEVFIVAGQVAAFVLAGLAFKFWFFPPAARPLFIFAGSVAITRLAIQGIDHYQKDLLDKVKNKIDELRKEHPTIQWVALGVACAISPVSHTVSMLISVICGIGTGILIGRDASDPQNNNSDLSSRHFLKMFRII